MTYQALARKWRPRTFAELAGQEHVVRALGNALDRNRLHHAYLLTGTRGVGKTTIARIFAKSLNCVTGVTATPCGVCPACVDIDAGRFVDLLELDAASNTGVDNMREILDNARYAPTVGRFKVYLIDEVHMLSRGAFNSMLKTLEEPPDHVKFVLATTEAQKIPVTVLSRCLQFNLKQLPAPVIAERLASILAAEGIAGDPGALALVARGARGSMRDALSLLDQAIAYGGGEVREEVVRNMLGTVDSDHVYQLVEALITGDGATLLAGADALQARGVSGAATLEELASLFHRIAVAQTVPGAVASFEDAQAIESYAARMTPEAVQLAYQICIQGRPDLALAPDESMGLQMTLLRLLAFEPATAGREDTATGSGETSPSPPRRAEASPPPVPSQAAGPRLASRRVDSAAAPAGTAAPSAAPPRPEPVSGSVVPATAPESATPAPRRLPGSADDWVAIVAELKLTGMAGQLAAQSEWRRTEGREIVLSVAEAQRHLTDRAYADRLAAALETALGAKARLRFEIGAPTESSLAAQERRERADQKMREEAAFRDEPFVREVLERFDARIKPDSIKPAS